ncbi:STP3 [Candida jiufengensis]|uniref:STP3 n=1 Tax=Candida jiufengensis TaxID=497108 RepID=UPI002224EBF2|nr:STP3 [Candida jiufengensis]KAI5952784.1 STP3 [Candida jiufengensis]
MSILSIGLFKSFSNEDLYTISKSYPINSSIIYQPFTSKSILNLQFNIHKFLNRLIYGTKRINELFPSIKKITNINNQKRLFPVSAFPINCAADDLDLGFDGGDQIQFFNNNNITDIQNNHPENDLHHDNLNYNNYSSNFNNPGFNTKGGFNDDIVTPLYQHQYQYEMQQQHQQQMQHQQHHQQQQYHQQNHIQNLPMFDDFFEAHQHHNHNYISNKFNENIFEASTKKRNTMDVFDIMNKSTISFSPKTSKLSKDQLNNVTYEETYQRYQEYQEYEQPPYFDDFQKPENESNGIKIPKLNNHQQNQKCYENYLQQSIGGTTSSISSADSFLSPLDDEIFGKFSKSSPESFSYDNNKLTLHSQNQNQNQSQSLPAQYQIKQEPSKKVKKRKLEISSPTMSSSSSNDTNDSDLPISPTNTIYKQPKQKSEKPSPPTNKKVKLSTKPKTKKIHIKKEKDTLLYNEEMPTITTTRTNNQTVRKLSYTTKTGKIDHTFECPHCEANFKVKGYLTRHLKKHNSSKAFMCPFYQENGKNGTKCHPTGGFSRRDTFKTHLKALHFIYPPGTKSNERNMYSGRCAGCFQFFENNFQWLEKHIETGQCQGTVQSKEQINERLNSCSSSTTSDDLAELMEDNGDDEEEIDDVDDDEDEDDL